MPSEEARPGQRPSSKPGARVRGRSSDAPADGIRPGTLTELLQQIAAVPEDEAGAGWAGVLSPGQLVGRFELVREIGRGGFGVVWEARDQKLGRSVAFKAVRAGGKAALREERLLREAEAAARLSHPNLVTLHDVGRTEQGPYLVLELLKGHTLDERLDRGPLTVREAVRVALEITKGVAHAHAQGVVHRDLKPANVVLCDDGQVKVLDFGMAHAFGRKREEGGTPAYMAPEQWAGAPEDERTDVFALGTMIFEMTSGELPFPTDDDGKAIRSRAKAPELEIPESPALADIVAAMLEKDPTARPRDGVEVLAALTEIHRQLELLNATPTGGAVRRRRRSHWRVGAGVAGGLVVGTLVAVFVLRGHGGAAFTPHDDRILVAVADFANETRDPDLDGLSGLLITSLEQSKKLRVLTRGRMIDLVREMGHEAQPRIDESVARAAGQKAGVRTLLLASIQKLGDTYAAELRALDPHKDEYLFTVREQANAKDDLLPLIDRISERTRLALREPDADVKASEVKVGEAVTDNLEAYRHYFLGKDLAARGHLKEAVSEYRRAAQIEPHFALAQVEVAWVGFFSGGSREESRIAVRDAARSAKNAPEKEAALLRIAEAFFNERYATTRAEILKLGARYPEDQDVATMAAQLLFWCGYFEDAIPFFDRALRLSPDWDSLRPDEALALAYLGRAKEAAAKAEAAARARGTPLSRATAGAARLLAGDVDGGIQAMRASGSEDPLAKAFLAEALASQGRFTEALAAVAAVENGIGDSTRAIVLAYAGKLRQGLGALEAGARRPGADADWDRRATGWYAAAAGRNEDARALLARGDSFSPPGILLDGITLMQLRDERRLDEIAAQFDPASTFQGRFLRALAAYGAGDRKKALSEFRALDAGNVSFAPFFHGLLAAEAERDDEAVDALRRFQRPAFWSVDAFLAPWYVARARHLEARSLDRLGRRDEARKVLDLQLERWKAADADLPLLADLRTLRASLDAPATPPVK